MFLLTKSFVLTKPTDIYKTGVGMPMSFPTRLN